MRPGSHASPAPGSLSRVEELPQAQGPPIRFLVLLVIASLFLLGIAQAAWNFRLEILGTINTSELSVEFLFGFTDDNGRVDDPNLDPGDNGECSFGDTPESSCDPATTGPGPKDRHDRDVGSCVAGLESDGNVATVLVDGAYPGYACTAWFPVISAGSLPVRVSGIRLSDDPLPLNTPTTADLTGDGQSDVAIELSGFESCQQLDPGQQALIPVGQQILSAVPANASLGFEVQIDFQQWNVDCEPPT